MIVENDIAYLHIVVLSWRPRPVGYIHAGKKRKCEDAAEEIITHASQSRSHNKPHQSSNIANSDARLRFANSARAFEGSAAAPQLFMSLLLGQLPLLPAAPAFAKAPGARKTTTGRLRRHCNFFAALCNCSRRIVSSKCGKQRPLRAAGSRRDSLLWHRLHCSIGRFSRLLTSRAATGSFPSRLDKGPMSFPCWHAMTSEERRRWA